MAPLGHIKKAFPKQDCAHDMMCRHWQLLGIMTAGIKAGVPLVTIIQALRPYAWGSARADANPSMGQAGMRGNTAAHQESTAKAAENSRPAMDLLCSHAQ